MSSSRPVLRPGQVPIGLGILVSTCIFFMCTVGFIQIFLAGHISDQTAATRIAAVLQDILVFMLPAMLTAMLVTRMPATFLQIDRRPGLSFLSVALITLVVSIPVMNLVVMWNSGVELPEPLRGFESWARNLEDAAQVGVTTMLGNHTVGSRIVAVAIIGVLAPLCEELFFRGALQRLLMSTRMNAHVVVWLTALIFSTFHLQFFGFMPRLLLGAYFGYIAYWSGSLWTSAIAHMLNNVIVVALMYSADAESALNTVGTDGSALAWTVTGVSLLLVALGFSWLSCHRPAARRRRD